MADCMPIEAITEFVSRDKDILVGNIQKVLIRKAVYNNTIKSGKLPNVSNEVRTVVQERAAMAGSKVHPNFLPDIEMCSAPPVVDRVGNTEYKFGLETFRGRGPEICVKTARTAFMQSYMNAQMALQQGIYEIINYDIRWNYFLRSGVKYVVTTQGFEANLTGDQQLIDVPFSGAIPDGPLTFKTLYRLQVFLKEEMITEPYESAEGGEVYKFIGSADIIEKMRNELNVREDLRFWVGGSFKMGEKNVVGYQFYGPYRGIAFGIDPQPIRFNELDVDGFPIVIEPEIAVPVTNGYAARRNPAWVNASYEVGFLMGADSFERWVPEQWTSDGKVKFDPVSYTGELEWAYFRDNDCNLYGDRGRFIYEIQRAYRPIRPHAVIPILYKRCNDDLGVVACDFFSSSNGL